MHFMTIFRNTTCSKTKDSPWKFPLDGIYLVGTFHCWIYICINSYISIFSYTSGYQTGKKLGRILIYMFSVIFLHQTFHIHTISPHMCCTYFHISLGGKTAVHIMRYHHILVSIMGSHCYERGNSSDPRMIFCRKKLS